MLRDDDMCSPVSVSSLDENSLGCRVFRRIAALCGWKEIIFHFAMRHIGIFTILCRDGDGNMERIGKWFDYGCGDFSVKKALNVVVDEITSGIGRFGPIHTRLLGDLVSDSVRELELKLTLRGV